MVDPCKTATVYADRIMTCKTIDELRFIWDEINTNRKDLVGWYEWLIDIKNSAKLTLSTPEIPDEEFLNKKGLEAMK